VLVPGQVITSKIADYLGNLLRSTRRMEMHGVVHEGYLPCIRVLKPAEEKDCSACLEKMLGFSATAACAAVLHLGSSACPM